MIDVTIQPLGLDVSVPEEEQLEAGAPPLVQFTLVAGQALPIPGPDGGPARVPQAQIHFALPKEAALKLAEMAIDQADKLPDVKESGILIANDLSAAEKAAQEFDKFRGRNQ